MNYRLLTTRKLTNMIKKNPNIVNDIEFKKAKTIGEYLYEVMHVKNVKVSDLVLKTRLSKQFIYQILNNERSPSKNTVMKLSFALELSLEEAQRALTLADNGALYPKVRRDAALMACFVKRLSAAETDEFLLSIGEESLL